MNRENAGAKPTAPPRLPPEAEQEILEALFEGMEIHSSEIAARISCSASGGSLGGAVGLAPVFSRFIALPPFASFEEDASLFRAADYHARTLGPWN